ncbi:MAG TPA: translation elongation factor Ts [Aggregatilineales bacterium]|nr:translation elongation factor Ts [Anaerolineae bacterium]HUN08796.1 translation elongation factor Ts [Aggregatilineales bacterium]
MAEITAQMVKDLRESTGAGPLDCKKALTENNGDFAKAQEWLREKGLSKAAKKLGAGRTMNEGLIQIYAHHNKRLGVMVEVNCETDFVANTDKFKEFAYNVSLQIANLSPQYVRREDIPAEVVEKERETQKAIALNEGKKPEFVDKVIDGRMEKFYEELVLMEQKFIKDDSKTIAKMLQETVAELGESIQIRRFSRFALGEVLGGAEESAE